MVDHDADRLAVEMRSVNHRFLKVSVRSTGPVPTLDRLAEEAVRRHIRRGHVSVHVHIRPAPEALATGVDDEAFAEVARRLQALARAHDLESPRVGDVLSVPGVVADPQESRSEALLLPMKEALEAAAAGLAVSRKREGALLVDGLGNLLTHLDETLDAIGDRAVDVPAAGLERLLARIDGLLARAGVEIDPALVVREAALLADRSDIQEEIERLRAHRVHAAEILEEGGEVGRRLDFLVQEMHRETNTIGSKTADLPLSRLVVDLKTHVERLREQVQNLE